jgi:hypothetical protein
MMPNYTIQRLPGEPIILGKAFAAWNTAADMPAFTQHLLRLLDDCAERVFWIADMSDWRPDVMELIITAHEMARSTTAVARHPKIREVIAVSQLPGVELAARGLNSQAFRFTHVRVCRTVEEALDYARQQIQTSAG